MNLAYIKQILSWPRRYRTSRGFGVHSPFAYDFITKVIGDRKSSYYAYPELDSMCGSNRRKMTKESTHIANVIIDREQAHLIFRVLTHFRPDHIIEVGAGREVLLTIYERALPKAKIWRWSREHFDVVQATRPAVDIINDAIAINATSIRVFLLNAIYQGPGRVIIFRNYNRPLIRQIFEEVTNVVDFGMTFTDPYTAIFVAIPGLPRQNYPTIL